MDRMDGFTIRPMEYYTASVIAMVLLQYRKIH